LRGVEDEVKRFVRGDTVCDRCTFPSDHDPSQDVDGSIRPYNRRDAALIAGGPTSW
jgi:hypothetical protein